MTTPITPIGPVTDREKTKRTSHVEVNSFVAEQRKVVSKPQMNFLKSETVHITSKRIESNPFNVSTNTSAILGN